MAKVAMLCTLLWTISSKIFPFYCRNRECNNLVFYMTLVLAFCALNMELPHEYAFGSCESCAIVRVLATENCMAKVIHDWLKNVYGVCNAFQNYKILCWEFWKWLSDDSR